MNDIKTWAERSFADNSKQLATVYMQAEIAELRAALAARATPAQPVATVIKHGAERTFMSENMGKLPDGTYSLYLHPTPSPSSVGAAITDQKITDLADDNDCGRTAKGYRLFSDRNLMAFARALLSEAAALAEQGLK